MQAPISLRFRKGLHVLTRRLITEVLVSSLSTLLAMAIFSDLTMTKPAPSLTPVEIRLSSAGGAPVSKEADSGTADFLERVALSHIGRTIEPPAAESPAPVIAAAETKTATAVPLPPRRATAAHDQPRAGQTRVVSSSQQTSPPAQLELASPTPKAEQFAPWQYAVRMVANIQDVVSASDKRVVESMASVGDALTSLVKKL